jgi:hypothetical protein
VVDEQQNYKHHRLICHHFNEEVQLEEVPIVVEVVINIMNNEIILMVKLEKINIKSYLFLICL